MTICHLFCLFFSCVVIRENPPQDELIEKLNRAEADLVRAHSDCKQLAEEIVSQYNRFQDENNELKVS